MPIWRKLIAAILLVLFAPVTVVAALPLIVCVQSGGGWSVEFAHQDQHHEHGATSSPGYESRFPAAQARVLQCIEDCHDIALTAAQIGTPKAADVKKAVSSERSSGGIGAVIVAQSSLLAVAPELTLPHWADLACVRDDPRLVCRSSTVLQI